MNEDRDDTSGRRLAAILGLELPPFDGPLVAFDPAGLCGAGDPIYLGGDLQAVHPRVSGRERRRFRDDTLDEATITLALGDPGGEIVETRALKGIWCLALHDELVDAAPYFSVWDTDGRLRTWLLLPPARLMIGLGQFWLPSIPPSPGSSGLDGSRQ